MTEGIPNLPFPEVEATSSSKRNTYDAMLQRLAGVDILTRSGMQPTQIAMLRRYLRIQEGRTNITEPAPESKRVEERRTPERSSRTTMMRPGRGMEMPLGTRGRVAGRPAADDRRRASPVDAAVGPSSSDREGSLGVTKRRQTAGASQEVQKQKGARRVREDEEEEGRSNSRRPLLVDTAIQTTSEPVFVTHERGISFMASKQQRQVTQDATRDGGASSDTTAVVATSTVVTTNDGSGGSGNVCQAPTKDSDDGRGKASKASRLPTTQSSASTVFFTPPEVAVLQHTDSGDPDGAQGRGHHQAEDDVATKEPSPSPPRREGSGSGGGGGPAIRSGDGTRGATLERRTVEEVRRSSELRQSVPCLGDGYYEGSLFDLVDELDRQAEEEPRKRKGDAEESLEHSLRSTHSGPSGLALGSSLDPAVLRSIEAQLRELEECVYGDADGLSSQVALPLVKRRDAWPLETNDAYSPQRIPQHQSSAHADESESFQFGEGILPRREPGVDEGKHSHHGARAKHFEGYHSSSKTSGNGSLRYDHAPLRAMTTTSNGLPAQRSRHVTSAAPALDSARNGRQTGGDGVGRRKRPHERATQRLPETERLLRCTPMEGRTHPESSQLDCHSGAVHAWDEAGEAGRSPTTHGGSSRQAYGGDWECNLSPDHRQSDMLLRRSRRSPPSAGGLDTPTSPSMSLEEVDDVISLLSRVQ